MVEILSTPIFWVWIYAMLASLAAVAAHDRIDNLEKKLKEKDD